MSLQPITFVLPQEALCVDPASLHLLGRRLNGSAVALVASIVSLRCCFVRAAALQQSWREDPPLRFLLLLFPQWFEGLRVDGVSPVEDV